MVTSECVICGKSFSHYPSQKKKCCSMACGIKARSNWGHGQSRSRLYTIWRSMKWRCLSPKGLAWQYYGSRGIKVCKEWSESFISFRAWAIKSGYSEDLELDRIDCDKGYWPNNCRWATRRQQMMNTRKRSNAKTSKYKGVSWSLNLGKWQAQIVAPGRKQHIGLYQTEEAAAKAYDVEAKLLFGDFARTNF